MVDIETGIGEEYFAYLEGICTEGEGKNRYSLLMRRLHEIPFGKLAYSKVRNDDNRASDGLYLRYEFAMSYGVPEGAVHRSVGKDCTVLEMMAALAQRIDQSITGDPNNPNAGRWFDCMIFNLGLDDCSDENWSPEAEDKINWRIDIMLNRSYGSDGFGGLWPLKHPKRDQRKIEIWYQMQDFLNENVKF